MSSFNSGLGTPSEGLWKKSKLVGSDPSRSMFKRINLVVSRVEEDIQILFQVFCFNLVYQSYGSESVPLGRSLRLRVQDLPLNPRVTKIKLTP